MNEPMPRILENENNEIKEERPLTDDEYFERSKSLPIEHIEESIKRKAFDIERLKEEVVQANAKFIYFKLRVGKRRFGGPSMLDIRHMAHAESEWTELKKKLKEAEDFHEQQLRVIDQRKNLPTSTK